MQIEIRKEICLLRLIPPRDLSLFGFPKQWHRGYKTLGNDAVLLKTTEEPQKRRGWLPAEKPTPLTKTRFPLLNPASLKTNIFVLF